MPKFKTKRKPKSKRRSSRKRVVVLGLVTINLAVFAALGMLATSPIPGAGPQVINAGDALAVQDAYQQALTLAWAWQADAYLAGATTSWQLATGDALTLQRPAWSFRFYSPGMAQTQVVTVDGRGPEAGPVQPVRSAPQNVNPDWGLDSDDLLLTFMSYGGQAFMAAHPMANIHAQLKAEGPSQFIWYITAIDAASRQSLLVGVDALTRQVLFGEPNEGGA
jgi:hypothetical protein